MKKLLFLTLLFLISFATFSQNRYTSTYNQLGYWNKVTEKWDWEDIKYATIPITFNKNVVTFENKASSKYIITSDQTKRTGVNSDGDSYTRYSWFVKDNSNRRCTLNITILESDEYDPIISIMYDDVCIRYYIGTTKNYGIDKF